MTKKIFVPQLDALEVAPIFKAHRWRKPKNITGRTVYRWHYGIYYGYGNKNSWFPLNSMGGIASKAFHAMTVKFPEPVEAELFALLDKKWVSLFGDKKTKRRSIAIPIVK